LKTSSSSIIYEIIADLPDVSRLTIRDDCMPVGAMKFNELLRGSLWERMRGWRKSEVKPTNRKTYKNKRQPKRLLRCGVIRR
jgi:hypothetical protein